MVLGFGMFWACCADEHSPEFAKEGSDFCSMSLGTSEMQAFRCCRSQCPSFIKVPRLLRFVMKQHKTALERNGPDVAC